MRIAPIVIKSAFGFILVPYQITVLMFFPCMNRAEDHIRPMHGTLARFVQYSLDSVERYDAPIPHHRRFHHSIISEIREIYLLRPLQRPSSLPASSHTITPSHNRMRSEQNRRTIVRTLFRAARTSSRPSKACLLPRLLLSDHTSKGNSNRSSLFIILRIRLQHLGSRLSLRLITTMWKRTILLRRCDTRTVHMCRNKSSKHNMREIRRPVVEAVARRKKGRVYYRASSCRCWNLCVHRHPSPSTLHWYTITS